ncbi:hypothetical protein COU37_01730 [Candidatus Micrarchaeota archaeon CG10_big_fil_rev_8_21_14_0_10_45_29]|nr:MAG: hypothetical protein COU37_01730 [Candidatus Micrarchaeota archaeon CG10_big_fil_rev_8_21_14_0_10_45_29]
MQTIKKCKQIRTVELEEFQARHLNLLMLRKSLEGVVRMDAETTERFEKAEKRLDALEGKKPAPAAAQPAPAKEVKQEGATPSTSS